jgi:molybdate transport repressor ModE-like protein
MAEQKRTALDWEDVRIFVMLARHGSLAAASRALGINHSTVSRRIQALEKTIGQRLVERRPGGYVLTPAGTRALAPANDMENAAAILARGGTDEEPTGLVRVNAPPTLTQAFLVERLATLSATYPGLDIDVATDVRSVSLERHETDIALRLAKPQNGDVMAHHLTTICFGFYGAEDVCAQVEGGDDPVFVGFDEANAYLPEAVWLQRQFPNARISFRTNNHLTQAAAARAGAGLALLPHYLGRADPRLNLCRITHETLAREVWMVTRRQDRKELSILTVRDFLAQTFSDERQIFEMGAHAPPDDPSPVSP